MKTLISVEALPTYRLKFRYDDGVEGMVDLSNELGKEIFKPWQDPEFFKQVRIGDFGQPEWPGEMEITGMTVKQMFPGWNVESPSAPA
jgi:hypothetical protein